MSLDAPQLDNGTLDANATRDIDLTHVERVVPWLWGPLIPLGVLGNGCVVLVMLRFGERNATDCYIINLALTDLTFILITVPFTMMHYIFPQWLFGVSICKLHIYMIYVTLYATCMTLTAMTVDRYYAIVHPIKSMKHRTPRMAVLVSLLIWMVSLVLCVPFAVFHSVKKDSRQNNFCREIWPLPYVEKVVTVLVVLTTYVIPLAIIVTCYSLILRHLSKRAAQKTHVRNPQTTTQHQSARRRRRTTKLVAVIVVLFATFWLPIHVFWLWFRLDDEFPQTVATYTFKMVGHTLSYTLSCINPFVYSFLGDGFRKAMRKAFPKIFRNIQTGRSVARRVSPVARNGEHTAMSKRLQADGSPATGRSSVSPSTSCDDTAATQRALGASATSAAAHAAADGTLPKANNNLLDPRSAEVIRPKPILAYEPRPECAVLYKPRGND